MKQRSSFRGTGIDEAFAKSFRESLFYQDVYAKHKDEIIIGVRDGFINLYYNCDSIAKIKPGKPSQCIIDRYYSNKEKSVLTDSELVTYYETIKENSDKRNKLEKQAQHRLFIDNNNNPDSEWFCIDLEYTKSMKGKLTAEGWRFDIIAISKTAPFRVAFIELKYGFGALGGKSGIRTHVKDFYAFYKEHRFEELKPELVSIIDKLCLLGVEVPASLQNIKCEDFASEPEFYFVTLNNNPETKSNNTPKQTMSGYLFSDKRWRCKRLSSLIKTEGDYFDLIEHDKGFKPAFLFSAATLPRLQISDILSRNDYEIEYPHSS